MVHVHTIIGMPSHGYRQIRLHYRRMLASRLVISPSGTAFNTTEGAYLAYRGFSRYDDFMH